jgi:tRNA A37 methylthiotransferase MiaB
LDETQEEYMKHDNSKGFKELYKLRDKVGMKFTSLLDKLSLIAPEVRFRFTSPHPKDFPEYLIDLISERHNVCKQYELNN